ncbi:hypothetical protein GCM10022198_20320 [Klugiella xanthotipulae]|uniref:Uncharacterized protein n=1 Tax=Klugiella xanthotipulae TaxID=244735 RepID=A0A543I666_9MICO|nr:hypothetical protein [Klugiella xanthotipulae]TQM66068.1 hypothetical protein FB466_0890 [Klugiella xanthotipulae]
MPEFILRLQPIGSRGRSTEQEVSVTAESPTEVLNGEAVPPGFTLVSWRRAGATRAVVQTPPAEAGRERRVPAPSREVKRVAHELMAANSIEWEVALTAAQDVVRIRESSARRYRTMNGFTEG